jgi:type IV pilus assembly protein PilE
MLNRQQSGFTLIELLVVVVVVAILLAVALPAYQRQVIDTRRTLASAALLDVMMRQEQFFLGHKRYAGVLTELDLPASPYAIDAQGNAVSVLAGERVYLIELTTRSYAYTLYATPQLSQASDRRCGTLSLDSTGKKLVAGTATARECW